MLLTILARMSNDEQRLQLLQTLRNKLSSYNLTWLDVRNIIKLFTSKSQIRFEILQFFLLYMNHSLMKMHIEDYIDLSVLCANNNEQLKVRLFERIYEKLNIRTQKEIEQVLNLFQTAHIRQKIETMIRIYQSDESLEQHEVIKNQQCSSHPELINVNKVLSPTLSSIEELSVAPLKRKYSNDSEYQDQSSHQIITPILTLQQDELIQQRDLLSSISISSSNSSISSASDENIPIRTHSFLIAIKNTFERFKKTSS